jgi:hypothetical protein
MSDAPYDQYSKGEVEKALRDRRRVMMTAFTWSGITPDSASFEAHLETIRAHNGDSGFQDENDETDAREPLEELKTRTTKTIAASRQKDVSYPSLDHDTAVELTFSATVPMPCRLQNRSWGGPDCQDNQQTGWLQ